MDAPQPPRGGTDRGPMLIAAAIVSGALILSWGMSSSEPRYQLAGAGDMVVRMNTDSGELIACNQQRCARIEAPDRAKTLGPFTLELGTRDKPALPAPEENEAP
jgi:hypothetical protein